MDSTTAALLATALNFVTLILVSIYFVIPWTRTSTLRTALIPLVAVHLGRTVALQLVGQADAIGMSPGLRDQIVWGDQVGFVVALITLVLLATRSAWAKPAAWLLVIVTALDLGNALIGGVSEQLLGRTADLSWVILMFYVPILWWSIALIAGLLYFRRQEQLTD